MNRKYYLLILLLPQFIYAAKPVVYIDLPALLGNRLWGFCVAKIIAKELDYDLHCKSIWGFPNTYSYTPHIPGNGYPWEHHECSQDIDLAGIIRNKKPRNIRINGYFQRYHYIAPYADIIRNNWLKIDPALLHNIDKDDIVVHVRFHVGQTPIKFEYYEKALSMATFKQLYICTDEPFHPYLKQFDRYKPIIKSSKSFESYFYSTSWDDVTRMNVGDFGFMASFNKIIISYSTYAWWAAFLSNATEIYAPWSPRTGNTHYGKVNEARYTYIETDIVLRHQELEMTEDIVLLALTSASSNPIISSSPASPRLSGLSSSENFVGLGQDYLLFTCDAKLYTLLAAAFTGQFIDNERQFRNAEQPFVRD
jgi:hypothetical protein